MTALNQEQFTRVMVSLKKLVDQTAKVQLARNISVDDGVQIQGHEVTFTLFSMAVPNSAPHSIQRPDPCDINRKRCMAPQLLVEQERELELAVMEYLESLVDIYGEKEEVPKLFFDSLKTMIISNNDTKFTHHNQATDAHYKMQLHLDVRSLIQQLNQDAGTNFTFSKTAYETEYAMTKLCSETYYIHFPHIPDREIEFTLNTIFNYIDSILIRLGLVNQPVLAPLVRRFFDPKATTADFEKSSTIQQGEPLSISDELSAGISVIAPSTVFQ
ncbi:MAG: hypothetical protein CK424_02125 [Legionella sp.]|nr:MAG: hypothetical protein CK424_02125 [Legionella sp.]